MVTTEYKDGLRQKTGDDNNKNQGGHQMIERIITNVLAQVMDLPAEDLKRIQTAMLNELS
jgi:hypothetical protein